MSKRFTGFFIVCMMLVLSGTAVFAATNEDHATVNDMLMTQDNSAVMLKDDMKNMCNDQTLAIMDKKSMDKMMVMMTVGQMATLLDNMMGDPMISGKMQAIGTKDQWLNQSKDQKNIAIDQMMLSMTQDQLNTLRDIMMMIMTPEQLTSMMTDNTTAMLTVTTALEPSQEDTIRMSKIQSLRLSDKLTMDRMMAAMSDDQMIATKSSMMNDPIFKDQMLAMGTPEQWATIPKDQMLLTVDEMMMTMPLNQMNNLKEKMMVTMSKDQMTTMMMNNTTTMKKTTVIVGYAQ